MDGTTSVKASSSAAATVKASTASEPAATSTARERVIRDKAGAD